MMSEQQPPQVIIDIEKNSRREDEFEDLEKNTRHEDVFDVENPPSDGRITDAPSPKHKDNEYAVAYAPDTTSSKHMASQRHKNDIMFEINAPTTRPVPAPVVLPPNHPRLPSKHAPIQHRTIIPPTRTTSTKKKTFALKDKKECAIADTTTADTYIPNNRCCGGKLAPIAIVITILLIIVAGGSSSNSFRGVAKNTRVDNTNNGEDGATTLNKGKPINDEDPDNSKNNVVEVVVEKEMEEEKTDTAVKEVETTTDKKNEKGKKNDDKKKKGD